MTSFKVAVLLATHNGEKYIKEQLDSILNQSFEDYKIIIRDDCSTDKTFEILKEYKNAHKDKIEIFKNDSQLGVVSNFEKLIQDT
ncbi:MAG TPA: glycosyltransferase, partial [Candidatus Atribacteria bacterium]|nr:glycosyltransferase [Candidatus Atribacteria bacterium]